MARRALSVAATAVVMLCAALGSAPVALAALPGAPTGVSATAGNALVSLSWSPVTSTPATTRYIVSAFQGSTGVAGCSSSSTSCTVTGLTNGTTYTFYVQAQSFDGTGPASATVSATPVSPVTAPGPPTSVRAFPRDAATIVSWTAPAATGGAPLSTYYVLVSAPGYPSGACSTTALTCTVSGLVNGVAYGVRVSASNTSYEGPPSSPDVSVTPLGTMAAPTSVGATAGDGRAAITWGAPPSMGGWPLTGYTAVAYSAAGGGSAVADCRTTGALSCTITGLANGTTYYVGVSAYSGITVGTYSTPRVAVTPAAPASGGGGSTEGSTGGGASGGGTSGSGGGSSGGGSSSGSGSETGVTAPTISRVSPARGPVTGGTVITIRGTNLTGATKVTIGGVRATRVVVVNATTIRLTTPRGRVGARAVAVTTPGGTAIRPNAYAYVR